MIRQSQESIAPWRCGGRAFRIVDLHAAAGDALQRLPYVLRILLENAVRCSGGEAPRAVEALLGWLAERHSEAEIPFQPARVLMHDTTCGPALVDIAGMRSALAERGGDPHRLSPVLPVDISTDHSVAVDEFATSQALEHNMRRELARNAERYRFMKWATKALSGIRVHPPGTGIMHTLNLERLATVVGTTERDGLLWAFPDTLIGTDSHTPMINGIGVLGWGVGGIEAESVCFGMPVIVQIPDVVGVRVVGRMRPGVSATDLALTLCERLRRSDLAGRFVEFFGPGVDSLTVGTRAVVANMTPEYGATCSFFPVDRRTLDYLRVTGRSGEQALLVEDYCKQQGLWHDPLATPGYTTTLVLDLGEVGMSLAGPRRPQDRIDAGATGGVLAPPSGGRGAAKRDEPGDGAVAIAAITSCTNTSDPRLLIAAGLLARNAIRLGLRPPSWVKTSLAPGSPTAASYLRRAGLLADLEAIGFGIVGYGCTTCIGNSGPLSDGIEQAIRERNIVPVAVLSGNRNFPGRIHPRLEAAFLGSPPLVVAFALAGDINRNILADPIGRTADGAAVRLADLWPTDDEIEAALAPALERSDYDDCYERAEASAAWAALDAPGTALFPWDDASTYIRRPPFAGFGSGPLLGTYRAHPLMALGDDVTTDHISPAGAIPEQSAAADYLAARGEDRRDLNVFAARRGNWEVMVRGLFTNRAVRNLLGAGIAPGSTIHAGSGEELPLWQAAQRYAAEGVPVVLLAGERYGMGSSRDWAAKGLALLGVRAVLALGFERIHRSNLIGMGILPLQLPPEWAPARLALSPGDTIGIEAPVERIEPRARVRVRLTRQDGRVSDCEATAAVETSLEVQILRAGGMLPLILQRASEPARAADRLGRRPAAPELR